MAKKQQSPRTKLILVIALFAAFVIFMFTFGYGILEGRNKAQLGVIEKRKLDLLVLEREQQNFRQGRLDIEELESKEYPPQELFSKDTKVVKEIKQLENLASDYNLEFTLGVTGGVETAEEATEVTSELLIIPYTITLEGAYLNLIKYLQAAEHTLFVNHTSEIRMTSQKGGTVRTQLFSRFYLKK